MAKFSSIIQGPRVRKTVELPLPGATVDRDTGAWVGPTIKLDVRALRGDEHDTVLAESRKYAVSKGLTDPKEGDDLFERGRIIHTLLLACVDVDSPINEPAPFFASANEILSSEVLTPEVLAYLYEHQQLWQDEVNPLLKSLSPVEFANAVLSTAEGENGDMSFFVSSRPGMQWSFMLSMAKLLAGSMTLASRSFNTSEPSAATKRA